MKDVSDLTAAEYDVIINKGTERPHSHPYNHKWENGAYCCKFCGQKLFASDHKYDPGCGWPSFFDKYDIGAIDIHTDYSHGMIREEIVCSSCGAHLGHVFPDGPQPTGLRYCVNGTSLIFQGEED
ncbi:MAG: peptide-methionine (R)-S-oxide reductase MsrB [Pseudomonadota bacterium]